MQASSLNTRRRWLLTFLLSLVIWSVQSAEAFDIAIGGEKGPAYNLGVGISSLVKVKLLPTSKIDFDPVVTKDDQASLEALNNGSADFALVASDDQNLPTGVFRLEIIGVWARDHRHFWLRLFEIIRRSWLTISENGLGLSETGSHY